MIEVIYKEEKKEAVGNEGLFHIPKNIRQIGEINAAHKIYMEDYVHTFLARIAAQPPGAKVGLLLGKSNWMEGITYIFVKSALQLEDMDVSPEHIVFTNEIWQQAEEKNGQYFPGQETVGWFFIMPEYPLELTDVLYRTHLNYFGGNDKLLYMLDPAEKDEAFFQYENGCMGKQRGFYLYYDKNEPMQEYMIEMNKNIPIEDKNDVKDKAVQDFRKIIAGKPVQKEPGKTSFSFLHAIGACAVVGAIAVGITYLNNYEKMKEASSKAEEASLRFQEEGRPGALSSQGYSGTPTLDGADVENGQSEMTSEKDTLDVGTAGEGWQEDASGEATDTEGASTETSDAEAASTGTSDAEAASTGTSDAEAASTGTSDAEAASAGTSDAEAASTETTDAEGTSSGDAGQQLEEPSTLPESTDAQENQLQGASLQAQPIDANETYVVRYGDTLSTISKQIYGNTSQVDNICQINGLNPGDIIYPGQIILLP